MLATIGYNNSYFMSLIMNAIKLTIGINSKRICCYSKTLSIFRLLCDFFPNLGNFPLLKGPGPFPRICKKEAAHEFTAAFVVNSCASQRTTVAH